MSYWHSWGADPERDEQNRRFTRIEAGLASTLVVEATLHHLDLVAHVSATGLAEVRRVVEMLLDRQLTWWSDERAALVGTGRAVPSAVELGDLDGAAVPVFT